MDFTPFLVKYGDTYLGTEYRCSGDKRLAKGDGRQQRREERLELHFLKPDTPHQGSSRQRDSQAEEKSENKVMRILVQGLVSRIFILIWKS